MNETRGVEPREEAIKNAMAEIVELGTPDGFARENAEAALRAEPLSALTDDHLRSLVGDYEGDWAEFVQISQAALAICRAELERRGRSL